MPGGRRGGDEAGPDLGEVLAVVGELDLGVAAGERGEAALDGALHLEVVEGVNAPEAKLDHGALSRRRAEKPDSRSVVEDAAGYVKSVPASFS